MYQLLAAVSCISGNLAPIVTSDTCMKAIFRGAIVYAIITVISSPGWNFFGEIDRTRLKDAETHTKFTPHFTISWKYEVFYSSKLFRILRLPPP